MRAPSNRTVDEDFAVQLCRQFAQEHGHLDLRMVEVYRSYSLGRRLHYWRQLHRRGQLPVDLVTALDGLGICWEPRQQQWDRRLTLLARFIEVHGHGDVPKALVTDGIGLGQWLANQRRRATGPRRTQLVDLGARMTSTEAEWENWFRRYVWDRSQDCRNCGAPGWVPIFEDPS